MSIECNNTTPAASRFSNLTVPIAGSSIDLSALIAQPDPLDQVANRAQVISLTDKLNSVLDQEDLSAYPTLKERYDQFPLTYTEIASYVIDNRVNTSDVLDAINNYGGGSNGNGSGGTGLPGNNVVLNVEFKHRSLLPLRQRRGSSARLRAKRPARLERVPRRWHQDLHL